MGLDPPKKNNDMYAAVTKLNVTPAGRFPQDAGTKSAPTQLELWSSGALAPQRERLDVERARVGFGAGLTRAGYGELEMTLDPHDEAIWCFMRAAGAPSFTPTLLRELISVRRTLQHMFANLPAGEAAPIKYFIAGSRAPGVYSRGGDLKFFLESIRARDHAALRNYAHDWADVIYHLAAGFHLPLMTIALVQGDAMAGGFECALAGNVLIAEKSAKFGLPPALCNMFPGLAAFSLLSRKLDAARAQQMIFSGRSYSATELHAMGLVDVLAEDGRGEQAARDYIMQHRRHHNAQRCIRDATMRVVPPALDELVDIADMWVEHAMSLPERDLREIALQAQPLA